MQITNIKDMFAYWPAPQLFIYDTYSFTIHSFFIFKVVYLWVTITIPYDISVISTYVSSQAITEIPIDKEWPSPCLPYIIPWLDAVNVTCCHSKKEEDSSIYPWQYILSPNNNLYSSNKFQILIVQHALHTLTQPHTHNFYLS